MRAEHPSIFAAGARTAIGATLLETALGLATGVRRTRVAPVVGRAGQPLRHAPVLPPSYDGAQLVDALLEAASHDLAASFSTGAATKTAGTERLAVVLLADLHAPPFFPVDDPEGRFLSDLALAEQARLAALQPWPGRIARRLGGGRGLALVRSIVAPADASLAGHYLQDAVAWLEQGLVDVVVLGGIGASAEALPLRWLALQGLLSGPDCDEGIVAGQGAALVALRAGAAGDGLPRVLAARYVDGRGRGVEALMGVTEGVLAEAGGDSSRLREVVLDATGMPGRKAEWALASTRTLGRRGLAPRISEPVLGLGDIGAATLPLLLGLLTTRVAGPPRSDAPSGSATWGLIVLSHGFSTGRAAVLWENDSGTGAP